MTRTQIQVGNHPKSVLSINIWLPDNEDSFPAGSQIAFGNPLLFKLYLVFSLRRTMARMDEMQFQEQVRYQIQFGNEQILETEIIDLNNQYYLR
ncbi:MAG: hypothetical protein KAH38_11155 [Candidatus Hydrogenedentes bacterium]|nr:hypothetical protein [Candidatus Hydrogenedentota bacterium]